MESITVENAKKQALLFFCMLHKILKDLCNFDTKLFYNKCSKSICYGILIIEKNGWAWQKKA